MEIDDASIKEFQALYLARFGIEVAEDEARHQAASLFRLVELLLGLD